MNASKPARIFVADQPVDEHAWTSVALHGLGSVVQWDDAGRLLGAVLENAIPDLVFLGADRAVADGVDVCRQLMLNPTTRDTPVILVTEEPDEAFVSVALEAGAADVLGKPLNPELLCARVRTYLALSRRARKLGSEARARSEELERTVDRMRGELDDRTRTLARAEFVFNHDLITGLPNGRCMIEMMERTRRRAAADGLPMAVIAVGIEHYSALKSSMEPEQFDRMLAAAAVCMQRTLRPLDFVARSADDLFSAVLVPHHRDTAEMAARQAREIVERTAAALHSEITLDGRNLPLEVRTAIAIYPQDGESARDLLKHLDQTLTITRREGSRERRDHSATDLASALALELRLRQAIESDRLIPYYQPKIDSRSGALLGGETLIRWPLRNGEYVGPAEFVPVAEAGGLIPALDDYVLTAACVQIANWQSRFESFRIGVNLSALKLHRRGVFERLRQLFALTGARARHLELEITESALITDFDAAAHWLAAVREMGVSVVLDDFGTGYSSLSYLRRLPLDGIKIDQTFVGGLVDDRSTVAIVRAMISMAKALDMRVVAEGVETGEQARILTQLGCDGLQGFLFSPAVPASRFEAMLTAGCVDSPQSGASTGLLNGGAGGLVRGG